MVSDAMCVFRFRDEKALKLFRSFESFDSIMKYVAETWSAIDLTRVNFYYSFGEHQNCKLVTEGDFDTVTWLVDRSVVLELEILIVESIEPLEVEPTINVRSLISEDVTNGRNVSNEDSENEEETEVNYHHTEKVLRSQAWAGLIKEPGQCFHGGVKEFRRVVAKFACQTGYPFQFGHNRPGRVSVYCKKRKESGCKWYLYASVDNADQKVYLRKFIKPHTCGPPRRDLHNVRLSADVVKDIIFEQVRSRTDTKPRHIVKLLKYEYGFNITYKVAYGAINNAKNELFGDFALSYNRIQAYFDKLKAADPSSEVELQCEPGSRTFSRCHFAFGACLAGFNACRPLLFLDATFLKNRYKGQLLVATAKDANQGLFPVAFSVVRSEDSENWIHFLKFLAPHIDSREVTFVTDRHGGIANALQLVFPNAPHAFCQRHLKENLKKKFRNNSALKDIMLYFLDRMARATTVEMYEYFENLFVTTGSKRGVTFLNNLPKEKFSNAFFCGKRYGEMTSNAAESFNSQIKETRELPVTELIDAIRVLLMEQMYERQVAANKCQTILSPKADLRYEFRLDFSRPWFVLRSSSRSFQVMSDPIMVVDIQSHTCSCGKWQAKGYPCSHAVAAIEHILPRNTSPECYGYVEMYWHTSMYRETYARSIPALSTFQFEADVDESLTVHPPIVKKQPGRPKKKRFPSEGEYSIPKKRICTGCHSYQYHNRATCDNVKFN